LTEGPQCGRPPRRARLRSVYDRVVEVDHIAAPRSGRDDEPSWWNSGMRAARCTCARWLIVGARVSVALAAYTKLNVWNLAEYDKVVYIDADAMVVDNIDEVRCAPCTCSLACSLACALVSDGGNRTAREVVRARHRIRSSA